MKSRASELEFSSTEHEYRPLALPESGVERLDLTYYSSMVWDIK